MELTPDGPVLSMLGPLIDDGLVSGWVVEAHRGDTELRHAEGVDGLHRPLEVESTFRVYCAMKPVLAMSLGVLVDQGELSWDDDLADVVEGFAPGVTVAVALEHRSGIVNPRSTESATMGPAERLATALGAPREPVPRPEHRYTEGSAWLVLAEAVRCLTGGPCAEFTRREVLDPLGLGEQIVIDERVPASLRVNVATNGPRALPLLIERTAVFDWEHNPGYGGAASVGGLISLTSEMVAASGGNGRVLGRDTAVRMLTASQRGYDPSLARECSFGLGWWTGLVDHGFPGCSPSAFGHAGLAGMTFVWADPDVGTTAGVHLVGYSDPDTLVGWLRPALVRALNTELASSAAD